MHFYLKEPKKDKESIIIIQYKTKNDKSNFKYSTSEKIHPSDWNFQSKLPNVQKGKKGAKLKKITTNITKYNDYLLKVIDEALDKEILLNNQYLKERFDEKFGDSSKRRKRRNLTKKRFLLYTDFVEDFIERARDGMINKNTNKEYSKSKIKQYNKTLNRVLDYEKHTGKKIPLNAFTQLVYDDFVEFCRNTEKYSITYTGDLIKNIKVFLNQADREGNKVHGDVNKRTFTVMREISPAVYLDESDIDILAGMDLSQSDRLQNVRDWSILGVWTGLRGGDLLSLPEIDPEEDYIEVVPSKTRDSTAVKVIIPLHPHVKEVLRVRGMPRRISDVKLNLYVKEVCEMAGLDALCEGFLMDPKTKRKQSGVYPKYKLVSSHTFRRSFATNHYLMGFPILSIMKITGHKTIKSFLEYIKITPKEHAENLKKHYDEYYKEKGLKAGA